MLCFSKEWEHEDQKSGKSNCRRTGEVLLYIMNSVMPFLKFTLERTLS